MTTTDTAAESTDTREIIDLTTMAGRAGYLQRLAVAAEDAGRLAVEWRVWRVWRGNTAVRLYIGNDRGNWVGIDDAGDLTFGAGAAEDKWIEVESPIIDSADFKTGPIAREPAPVGRCRDCGDRIQPWSDGAYRGRCHDCA